MRRAHTPSARPGVSRRVCCLTAAGVLALLVAPPASRPVAAQTDARWDSWLGCWELLPQPGHEPPAAPVRTCVLRMADRPGVRISTAIGGASAVEETLVADGAEWPIEDGPCRGVRRAEWSRDGRRLFSRARIQCEGSPPHAVSHLAMIAGDTWIDIQGITRETQEALRVRRYRPAGEEPKRQAGGSASALSIEEVKEASAKVSPLVLQAALVETRARFRLTGRTMIDLDRAGVPGEVTDLMVALSYPERFRVRPREPDSGFGPVGLADCGVADDCVYGWDPFAYSYWGLDEYWNSGDVIVIGPPDGGGQPDARGGRVVNHRGYTRIEPAPVDSSGHSRDGSRSTASTDSSSPSGDSGSSTGNTSGGVSSQGYSSGSSSGDSDRTAQPRPPR